MTTNPEHTLEEKPLQTETTDIDSKALDEALDSILEKSGVKVQTLDIPTLEEPTTDESDGPESTSTESGTPSSTETDKPITEDTTTETDIPLSDRLKEFEQDTTTEPSQPSPRKQLEDFEVQLKHQELQLQQNFLNGLPDAGVFQKDGKTIYQMGQQELNDYIIELQDKGQALAAGQVYTNYTEAIKRAEKYQGELTNYQENASKLHNAKNFIDWQEIRTEVATKLPELTEKDFEAVATYVDQKAQSDALYYQALSTKEGKLQKGVDALNALGILKRLKAAKEPDEPTTLPSSPDTRPTKRVSTQVNTGELSYNPNVDIKTLKPEELHALLDFELKTMLKG